MPPGRPCRRASRACSSGGSLSCVRVVSISSYIARAGRSGTGKIMTTQRRGRSMIPEKSNRIARGASIAWPAFLSEQGCSSLRHESPPLSDRGGGSS